MISSRKIIVVFLFLVPCRLHIIALRRNHNDGRKKKHEEIISIHRVVHIPLLKKKRKSTHAEGENESEDYIAS